MCIQKAKPQNLEILFFFFVEKHMLERQTLMELMFSNIKSPSQQCLILLQLDIGGERALCVFLCVTKDRMKTGVMSSTLHCSRSVLAAVRWQPSIKRSSMHGRRNSENENTTLHVVASFLPVMETRGGGGWLGGCCDVCSQISSSPPSVSLTTNVINL